MKEFAEAVAEDRRLRILQILAEAPGFDCNGSIIRDALEVVGHRASMDQVRTELAWLEEQGAVRLRTIGPVTVVTATERGLDAAGGQARIPGIRIPIPE